MRGELGHPLPGKPLDEFGKRRLWCAGVFKVAVALAHRCHDRAEREPWFEFTEQSLGHVSE